MQKIQQYFQDIINTFKQQENWATRINNNNEIKAFYKKIAWKIGYGNFTHFAGELRFDLPPAQRKVIVAIRQRPDAV